MPFVREDWKPLAPEYGKGRPGKKKPECHQPGRLVDPVAFSPSDPSLTNGTIPPRLSGPPAELRRSQGEERDSE
ncbi:MAG: hypothetical protein AMXMBFR19_02790 [Chthonomonadaceae bacterium]|uniref:Uncharacterized protein n=1 Tax=Candidatus Nitrosymbiomonas proteolyticus TaxID=2608984 RepID=A0A809RTH9_9BACT|nr:hypothetical protein NPRO_06370 [Candidatus Nitrosymbiomonas proteolyticus]